MTLEERVRAELNPAQAEAVLVNDRPQLILAGAGSGKTRVLTWKIAWLIGGLGRKPWEIVALTFTNKAAREMRERAEKLMGQSAPEWMGTFHGICARILRREGGHLGYGDAFTPQHSRFILTAGHAVVNIFRLPRESRAAGAQPSWAVPWP